jgi:hypothetical protein
MDWSLNFLAAGSDLGLFRSATQSLRDKYIAAA